MRLCGRITKKTSTEKITHKSTPNIYNPNYYCPMSFDRFATAQLTIKKRPGTSCHAKNTPTKKSLFSINFVILLHCTNRHVAISTGKCPAKTIERETDQSDWRMMDPPLRVDEMDWTTGIELWAVEKMKHERAKVRAPPPRFLGNDRMIKIRFNSVSLIIFQFYSALLVGDNTYSIHCKQISYGFSLVL